MKRKTWIHFFNIFAYLFGFIGCIFIENENLWFSILFICFISGEFIEILDEGRKNENPSR